MVTGFPPIVLANPMEIYKKAKSGKIVPLYKKNNSISQELSSIIMKMLEPDLKNRFKSTEDVLIALESMDRFKNSDEGIELRRIKRRLNARTQRKEYVCWNCRKVMPSILEKCLYCGSEQ